MTETIFKPPETDRLHVVICGSLSALGRMTLHAAALRNDGFAVTTPVPEENRIDWESLSLDERVSVKRGFLNDYFKVISDCDAVLIANFDKNGVEG